MEDLEKKFKEEWPEMFRDVRCGFYLPERWEDLLDSLCERIALELDRADLPEGTIKVVQVKEKFGGLRFYYDWRCESRSLASNKALNRIIGLVSLAEAASFLIK